MSGEVCSNITVSQTDIENAKKITKNWSCDDII
jgi:hypothetical protein